MIKNMTSKIKIHHESDVMVITVDNPPINAGSIEVRQGLLDAIAELENHAQSKAAVIIGAGSTSLVPT